MGDKKFVMPDKKYGVDKKQRYYQIIGDIFYWCVDILNLVGEKIGMTYEEVNVWVFCVAMPVVLIGSIGLNIYLLAK